MKDKLNEKIITTELKLLCLSNSIINLKFYRVNYYKSLSLHGPFSILLSFFGILYAGVFFFDKLYAGVEHPHI